MSRTWIVILGMAVVTYASRVSLFMVGSRITLPPRVMLALRFLPVALLSALVLPALLIRQGALALTWRNDYLWAGLLSALVAWRTRNTILTVGSGLLFVIAWRLWWS
jgi:branched-subunit amino acid transport protein